MEGFSKHLFWDCDPEKVDPQTHAAFLIGRVVMRGQLSDWKRLLEVYGTDTVRDEIVKLPYLDSRTLGFCSTYFEIPKSAFRCHKRN